jgi:hypothetical protein
MPTLFLSEQLLFSYPFHALDLDLPAHGTAPIWLFFHIDQPRRAPVTRVPCALSKVVLAQAPLGVSCPTGVIGSIRTFQYVTEENLGGWFHFLSEEFQHDFKPLWSNRT